MKDSFKSYLDKNWVPIKDMWVGYSTNTKTNLGNTTNNRIESFNQKVKGLLGTVRSDQFHGGQYSDTLI